MGLFDIFTGDAYKDAAAQQQQYYQQIAGLVNNQLQGAQSGGLDALRSGQYSAIGALQPAYSAAQGYITGAQAPALGAITGYGGQAAGAITGNLDPALAALRSGVSGAQGAYGSLADLGNQYGGYTGQTAQAQADALGLNGPEGVARARASFQTSPGYQFAVDQGLKGITRAANATGMGASGNTLAAAGTYATNAANQEWNNYLTGLQAREGLFAPLAGQTTGQAATGTANAALAGGTGAANLYTGAGTSLADLYSRLGPAAAGIYTGTAGNLANLSTGLGGAEASIYGNTAGSLADLLSKTAGLTSQFYGTLAPTYGKTYSDVAAAQTGGSQNLWNLIGGAATAAAGGGFLPSYSSTTGLGFGTGYGPYAPKPAPVTNNYYG